jgi:hypothetical protein
MTRVSPANKALLAAAVIGSLSLGAAGTAGAAGGTSGSTSAGAPRSTPGAQTVNCTSIEHHLSSMRHRQAELSARVARLESASTGATKAGRSHRAATDHRLLVYWQRIEAHKINARFLRREAKLATLGAAHCAAGASAPTTVPTSAPTTAPTTVPTVSAGTTA